MSKLRSTRGETLIETLTATLIIALSSILLLSMAVTAANINKRSDEESKLYQTELAQAETGGGATREGTLTITVMGGDTYNYTVVFSSDAGKLNSYIKEETP